MLTVEEIEALEIFDGVPAVELERLARKAADVHLATAEFLVHEGDARALFVVVGGAIELSKTSSARSG